jgi:hypothetical protein
MWRAIKPIAVKLLGCLIFILAMFGLPLALVAVFLFSRRLLSSPRPGKLGLEDVLRRAYRLSAMCGVVMVLLIVLGLAIGRMRQ